MFQYLKKLWKRYFRGLGYSRIKEPTRDLVGTGSDLGLEPLVPKPKPIHCASHKRYMKSCLACREAVK